MNGDVVGEFKNKSETEKIIDGQREIIKDIIDGAAQVPTLSEYKNEVEVVTIKQLLDERYYYGINDVDNGKLEMFFVAGNLFDGFDKYRNFSLGDALRRNLTGPIIEYSANNIDRTEELIYSIKSVEGDPYQVKQQMTGPTYDYLPTLVACMNLTKGTVSVPGSIELSDGGELKIGITKLKSDGSLPSAAEDWAYLSRPTEEQFAQMDTKREADFAKAKEILVKIVPGYGLIEGQRSGANVPLITDGNPEI
ncbi:MAG: hypothetical protein WCI79_02255 [Candidatus Saccharibacteria bacterium]